MKHLRQLEDQSVFILREAYKHFDHLGMLWSMGKDSTVLLWLARKAFFGRVPFPVILLDTGNEFPEVYQFRDRIIREWGLTYIDAPCPGAGAARADGQCARRVPPSAQPRWRTRWLKPRDRT